MSKFLNFKVTGTGDKVTVNASHIVNTLDIGNGECRLQLSNGKYIDIEADFDKLAMTLESL
ncbi:hypothetical protein [Vibrio vulnificus]|uniref:hypothetical protein n=1 Tax=Vibrio vulnificus TaxID=672 RepID=UPI000500A37D|nr:hypothetical protein [Vibrio vulnificus]KFK53479.1 hypothetical protein JS86_18395 [Vibrio vulnificus]